MNGFQLTYVRALGLMEGTSFIFLLFIAMPIRLATHNHDIVRMFGQAHGILFLMYAYSLISFGASADSRAKTTLLGFVCACIPFGPFWFDQKILKYVLQNKLQQRRSS